MIPPLKKILISLLKKSTVIRNIGRHYRIRLYGDLGWEKIISKDKAYWRRCLEFPTKNKKILTATSFGGEISMPMLESLVAAALVLRGARVHTFLCDGLPACQLCDTTKFSNTKSFIENGIPAGTCEGCFNAGKNIYKAQNLIVHKFSDFLSNSDIANANAISNTIDGDQIRNFHFEGIAVGEHAMAGTCRFFARATIEEEANGIDVLRRYLASSILVAVATDKLLKQENYDCAFFNHGIYVPQGIIGEVSRKNNVRVVNWNTAYKKKSFVFSHGDTYHHTMMVEPVSTWENINLTPELKEQITSYISSRAGGANDWIKFNASPKCDREKIIHEIGFTDSKPIIGLLTNVAWDAQLHYPANAFPNMIAWILKTIEYFSGRKDLQLLIRIHPAEFTGHLKSRQPVIEEIKTAFPSLPSNIFIISPKNKISTYEAMKMCDSVLIYGTKTGVELTSMGIPVIVAGEAWIRNKGITIDITSEEDYYRTLDTLPLNNRLDKGTQERALKYAFHFFNRRMIPIEVIEPTNDSPPFIFMIDSINDLQEGKCLGLDVICNGILNNTDFVYPAEKVLCSTS
jgi:hypothetical protein